MPTPLYHQDNSWWTFVSSTAPYPALKSYVLMPTLIPVPCVHHRRPPFILWAHFFGEIPNCLPCCRPFLLRGHECSKGIHHGGIDPGRSDNNNASLVAHPQRRSTMTRHSIDVEMWGTNIDRSRYSFAGLGAM